MKKADVQRILDQFPEQVDVDEFVRRLHFWERIERAERQLADGHGIDHLIAMQRLRTSLALDESE